MALTSPRPQGNRERSRDDKGRAQAPSAIGIFCLPENESIRAWTGIPKCKVGQTNAHQHTREETNIGKTIIKFNKRKNKYPRKSSYLSQSRESLQEDLDFYRKATKDHIQLKSKSVSQEEKKVQYSKSKQRF